MIHKIMRSLGVLVLIGVFSVLLLQSGCAPKPGPETEVKPAVPAEETAKAERLPVPPRTEWTAKASGMQEDIFPAQQACDGDRGTRWSSPPADPQWLQIDLGRPATITGCTILWETAYSSEYFIEVSLNGSDWQKVYENRSGDGRTDEIYFGAVEAQYLRITGLARGTGWGHSIFEVDIKGPEEEVIVTSAGQPAPEQIKLFDGNTNQAWASETGAPLELLLDLRKPMEFGGLRIDWGANYGTDLAMSISSDGEQWEPVGTLHNGTGKFDILMHPHRKAQYIRLNINETAQDGPAEITEISLRGPNEEVTPLALYQLAAQKGERGWYPMTLLKHQTYWTLVGLPLDSEESLLDEYGTLEPKAGASSLMPYIVQDGQILSAMDAAEITQHMVDRYLPLPSVEWHADPLNLKVQAITRGTVNDSATYVRYTLSNHSEEQQAGRLYLLIRPVQVNPTWQHGGLSAIEQIEFRAIPEGEGVFINDKLQYVSLTAVNDFGARAFNKGDIIEDIAVGTLPEEQVLRDAGSELSGALAYDFELAPGESKDVIIAAPLHESTVDIRSFRLQDEGNTLTEADSFDRHQDRLRKMWSDRIDRVVFELPQQDVADTMKAQIAYILINQDGVSIQPGSRNYKRAWIRDGSLTSAALLRMGLTNEVRNYINWYAKQVQPDGWVPPILNNDGSINQGFGWDNEYDSQGQFIFAVMEYYRFTHDKAFLEQHFEQMVNAMKKIKALCAETFEPGYMSDHEVPERFRGILPKSISHEGYSPAMHSYWDDFFALKGYKDGAEAARILGRDDIAQWADEEYATLRKAVQESIQKTVEYKKIDYVPGCAEKGDPDATSTAIAFFPCKEQDLPDAELMQNTFDRYYSELVQRLEPGWVGSFTPYEIRSILPFVLLGQNDRAKVLLDYMLSCRRPAAWNHLAEVVHSRPRMGVYIGDMPHTWVGSGYVNSIRGMFVQEENGQLILLPGIPPEWLNDDGITIQGLPTHFGPLDLKAQQQDKQMQLDIEGEFAGAKEIVIRWPAGTKPVSVIVDGTEWTEYDDTGIVLPNSVRQVIAEWP